jgi:hypothetical protein
VERQPQNMPLEITDKRDDVNEKFKAEHKSFIKRS